MTHIKDQADGWLHHEDGSHIMGAASADGRVVERFERDARRHHQMHRAETANAADPESATMPWECFGCGLRIARLEHGFDTACPNCASYELHLADALRAVSRKARR